MSNPQRFPLNFNQLSYQQQCQIKTYACLQQKQTIDFLTYLSYPQNDNRNNLNMNKHINKNEQYLYFNSQADDAFKNNKKTKVFGFDAIYNRTEKIKYVFGKMIKQVTDNALKGQNQTCFIYGTEQKCKDKILLGQSQNHGILLCILAQLFQRCHKKELQDQVTIKFSCIMFNNAKFINIFANKQDIEIRYRTDVLEGGTIQSIPQIIIRNIKTALKLLNIVLKQIKDIRDEKITQNLILTLKIELDCKKQRDQTTVYCISKINFIKFANPSINSILKGINKNNVWFVNLFTYIQSTTINTTTISGKQNINMQIPQHSGNIDKFTQYLQQVCFKGNHRIFGFVSISNKMTSNQCLTALLFGNYLKSTKIKGKKYFINLPQLAFNKSRDRFKILQAVKQRQNVLNLWALFTQLSQKYMNQLNYLQFQYSLVIGEACQKLNKYIFTEELQDFFYAKKINIQRSEDLIAAHNSVAYIRNKLKETKKLIIQQLNDSQIKDVFINWLNSQYSLAQHFLLDDSQTGWLIKQNLQNLKQRKQAAQCIKNKKTDEYLSKYSTKILKQKLQEFQKKNQKSNSQNTLKNQNTFLNHIQNTFLNHKQNTFLNHKQNKIQIKSPLSSIHMPTTKYKNNSIDYLQCMFTNKNVGITNIKF